MKYNSITLRRRRARQTAVYLIPRVIFALFAGAIVFVGLWLAVSFMDISANAPTFAGQAPEYWRHNLINILLEVTK